MEWQEEEKLRRKWHEWIKKYDLQTIEDIVMIHNDTEMDPVVDADAVREILGVNELWQLHR